ncbi:MAG: methyltransferase [Candidatus Micrarchaeota archaeon]|nr:methyltransferase [Candidatus Micrarchaeota archaeon]
METEWRGMRFSFTEAVYAPREDSFLLAEAVEKFAAGRVLDMGTGCGIQGITAARKKEVNAVVSADAGKEALEAARANAGKNGAGGKITFVQTDLFSAVKGKFDTIAFNPPYLPVSPGEKRFADSAAWDGGKTGRKVIDRFLDEFDRHLAPRGKLLFLSSSLSDEGKTLKKLAQKGFSAETAGEKRFFFEKITVIKAEKNPDNEAAA